jgi:hypothetical protein
MAHFGSKKGGEEYLAHRARKEESSLRKENSELKEALRKVLYQVEFHADEYKEVKEFEEDNPLLQGIVARFEGLANDLKTLARKYPQIKKAG